MNSNSLTGFIKWFFNLKTKSNRKREFQQKLKFPGDRFNPFHLSIFDKYLIHDFLKNGFGALFLFVFIFLIAQLIQEIPFYLKTNKVLPGTGFIILMYIYRIPYALTFLSPPAFLFSTIFTLGNFYKNNEVVAAIGSGVYLFRFTRPLWLIGLSISIIFVFLSEFVVIPTYDRSMEMNEEIRLTIKKQKDQLNLNVTGEGNMFYSMERYDANLKIMISPIIIKERLNVHSTEKREFQEYIRRIIKANEQLNPHPTIPQTRRDEVTTPLPSGITTSQNEYRAANQFPSTDDIDRPIPGEEVIDPVTLKPYQSRFEIRNKKALKPDIPLYINFRIDADKARWDERRKKWIVENGIIRYWDQKAGLIRRQIKRLFNFELPVKDEPYHFEQNIKDVTRMTFKEGIRYVEKLKRSNKKYIHELVDLYGQRLAFHFGTFIIIFIGMTLGQFHSRKHLFVQSLLFALGLFVLYYIFFQLGCSLGKEGVMHPFFAPWLGNVLFTIAAILLKKKAKT